MRFVLIATVTFVTMTSLLTCLPHLLPDVVDTGVC